MKAKRECALPPHASLCLPFRRTVLCGQQRAQAIHQRSHSRLESDLMLVEDGHGNLIGFKEHPPTPNWGTELGKQ